jgi:hypothetical protein
MGGGVKTYCERWFLGKPRKVALIASQPVMAAEECFGLLQFLFGELEIPVNLQADDLRSWCNCYSDQDLVPQALSSILMPHLAGLQAQDISENDLIGCLLGPSTNLAALDLASDSIWRKGFDDHKVRFFYRVTMPCILCFNRCPGQLVNAIGKGGVHEWESIENLLRLDPLFVHHPTLKPFLNCNDGKQRRQWAEAIGEAMGKPLPPMDKPRLKLLLAALMSLISEEMGHRLNEPEIRALFDAIARDKDGRLRDEDLPLESVTFVKAIQRNRRLVRPLFKVDIKMVEAVQALELIVS